ncbi:MULTISPECIES: hydroxyacid dehydrogenase [unclassified Achromobacter]|uniref:hydroxyacid dehydrogenase n=1 Tax=unclassified Achromobacter TaxID=2626865 RepID=UPI000B51D625|nr:MULTISPECIES: hydroxyacid dehydrogenase [unclassified Achromobacter]OWT70313.1 3-phosphoglycerate dehydrogenase [Achromobacter sp. HZ34]OWT71853.1 3-phosphoglycerate dehydrogenase [Achromobacter sp. HZ28]
MRIVISEFMDTPAVDSLRRDFDVQYEPDLVDRRDDLLHAVQSADALIVRNRTRVDAPLLAAAPKLKAVGRLGVGLDNIDMPACAARRIDVFPATGANARSVAEYVIATILLLLRGAYQASAQVAAGDWPRNALSNGREANQRILGIVGYGGIGRLVARLARGLDMRVIAADPILGADDPAWREGLADRAELDDLLRQADAVTLHIPLTDATRGLLDAERMAGMKDGAILINTARGGIIDEAALADALRSGKLGGAAIDVFDKEPLSASSALAGVPNLILTPHIAGLTEEANTRVSDMTAQRVAQALRKG